MAYTFHLQSSSGSRKDGSLSEQAAKWYRYLLTLEPFNSGTRCSFEDAGTRCPTLNSFHEFDHEQISRDLKTDECITIKTTCIHPGRHLNSLGLVMSWNTNAVLDRYRDRSCPILQPVHSLELNHI